MTPKQVIKTVGAGSQAEVGRRLGIRRQVVQQWVKRGRVPDVWQMIIAQLTNNNLRYTGRVNGSIGR